MENHLNIKSLLIELSKIEPKGMGELHNWLPTLYGKIAEEAQKQGVAPWTYRQIDHFHDDNELLKPLKSALKPMLISTLANNEINIALLTEIQTILAAHNIIATTLKGISMVMSVYPETALRPIGDLDLYVHPCMVFKARDILIAHGAIGEVPPLSPLHENNHAHVRALRYKGRMVELHQRLYDIGNQWNPSSGIDLAIEPFSFRNQEYHKLNKVYLTYHLTTHLAHNMKMSGCRLGWFVDIALIFSQEKDNAMELFQKLMQVNEKANTAIKAVVCYAMTLMSEAARNTLQQKCGLQPMLISPALLTESKQGRRNHKVHVFHNILRTPGFTNKVRLLLREVFPTAQYMHHFYDIRSSKGLIFAYLKRLTRFGK